MRYFYVGVGFVEGGEEAWKSHFVKSVGLNTHF